MLFNSIPLDTKNQLHDFQEHLQRFCNLLSVFGFSSAKYDLNLIKLCLLPILCNESGFKSTVIKEANSSFRSTSVIFNHKLIWVSWRHSQSWLLVEWLQNVRNKRLLPLRMLWSSWQKAEYKTSTLWRLRVNCVAVTLFQPTARTVSTFWRVDWSQNKLLSSRYYQSQPVLELRFVKTCNKYGSRIKSTCSMIFCAGLTIKMLFQLSRQCKKWLQFTTTTISICWI